MEELLKQLQEVWGEEYEVEFYETNIDGLAIKIMLLKYPYNKFYIHQESLEFFDDIELIAIKELKKINKTIEIMEERQWKIN